MICIEKNVTKWAVCTQRKTLENNEVTVRFSLNDNCIKAVQERSKTYLILNIPLTVISVQGERD